MKALRERDHLPTSLHRQMKHQRNPRKAAAHIQTAIEASCGALITLESLHARAGAGAVEDLRRPIQQAIESLRQTITELRSASDDGTRMPPGGFVLRASVPGLGKPRAGYASPRRTA